MSIATAITAAQAKVAAAYSKCNDKGATMPAAADQNLSHLAATIDTISGGGGGVTESDVNFFDYDGTLVAAYTAADFLALSALPANPSHAGLTAQGWNWTLADAKTVVSQTGWLDIGQMYSITSGHAEMIVDIPSWRLDTYIYCWNEDDDTVIDWGDGTTTTTISAGDWQANQHTYATAGTYTITVMPQNGSTVYDVGVMYSGYGFDYSSLTDQYNWGCKEHRLSADVQATGDYPQWGLTRLLISYGSQVGVCSFNSLLPFVSFPTSASFQGAAACHSIKHISTSEGAITVTFADIPKIIIPSTVTDVYNLNGVADVYLLPTTPPNVSNYATVVVGTIYVPNGTLATYQSATNWSNYASQMVEMPAAS